MDTASVVPVEVYFDAVRVCEAIARIGYEPYTAIMDIIDNSVTAKASVISVCLHLRPGKTLKMRNSVAKYQIVDNGLGMTHAEIQNAFTLGSTKNYGPNSLSKYGMGLKSAGLSLGSRISIVSKKNDILSDKYMFDIKHIETSNKLEVLRKALNESERSEFETLLPSSSGTVIEIDGCENVNQSSPGSTIGKLKDRLGVVYYSFLTDKTFPLNIKIKVSSENQPGDFEDISAKDLLFLENAKNNTGWTPDSYNFFSPFLVLDAKWDSLRDKDNNPLPPITIHAVAFPQASLANDNSPLTQEQKNLVRTYSVSRENSGFFIYRNGRLIRWGDGLERANGKPLITKDDINIRIRFEIQDLHDDILHVDVSKQRLEIDDEIVAELETIVSRAIKVAKEIRVVCKEKLKKRRGEGQQFSHSVRAVAEDDPQQIGAGEPSKETLDRQSLKNEEAKVALEKIESANPSTGQINFIPDEFQKIRYAEKIPYGQFWRPYFDAVEGVFICVNKNHPFYEEFISRFEEGTNERLVIEALIFAAGLAESNVYVNETNLEKAAIEQLFRRFHRNVDQFLQDWTWENLEEE